MVVVDADANDPDFQALLPHNRDARAAQGQGQGQLEVGDEGSPGLPPGDEPLSRDSFALRRLVRLIRRRTRGELGQEAAGGSMTREMR